jgi:hypothetical protein
MLNLKDWPRTACLHLELQAQGDLHALKLNLDHGRCHKPVWNDLSPAWAVCLELQAQGGTLTRCGHRDWRWATVRALSAWVTPTSRWMRRWAFVAVDLSGRPYAVIDAAWHGPLLGQMATTLVPHFLESAATHGRLNLHARVLYGRDDHHQAEALFKAFGRALDQATQFDPRRGGQIPSTKGTL